VPDFIVHSVPGSPFGRAVLLALHEKGAPYRLAPIPIATPRSAEHLALHPFGRIPAFDHGDFHLYETQAILRYLDRVVPEPALTPKDPKHAARMDQAMNINDWYLFHGVANVIVFQRVVGPRLLGRVPDEEAIAAAMPKALVVFNELARLLGEQPYFAGGTVSLADLVLAPGVEAFEKLPEWSALGEPHTNLVAWLKRMQERPSMKATTWERVAELAKAA
jgi:glutathione S-transferase